jgi:hypothetical protein
VSSEVLAVAAFDHQIGCAANLFARRRPILSDENKQTIMRRLRRAVAWGRLRLPFGLRTLLGLLLVIGGILGFLPILGFWMIPVGAVLMALDVPPLRRRLRSWLHQRIRPRRQWQGRTRLTREKEDR